MDYKVTCFFGKDRLTNPSSEQIKSLKKKLTESVAQEIFNIEITWSKSENDFK